MLVIGEKYNFIDLEKQKLKNKGFNLNIISYKK